MLKPRLYLHAEPHMDESSASWLIRTSELHGLTLKELFSALKVRKRRDLDLAVVPRVLDYFTRGMDYPTETLRQMTRFYQTFRKERWTHVWLKRLHGGGLREPDIAPRALQMTDSPTGARRGDFGSGRCAHNTAAQLFMSVLRAKLPLSCLGTFNDVRFSRGCLCVQLAHAVERICVLQLWSRTKKSSWP